MRGFLRNHFQRNFPINLAVEETVLLQFPKLLCERGLRDTVKAAQQFTGPQYVPDTVSEEEIAA